MREDIKINDRALALEKSLIEKLELVFDTDVELDVYNLGLIYEIYLDGIEEVKVEVTWSPAWKITRISRYGRIALGLPPR